MSSFVEKQERLFRDAGDSGLMPRRSVGRIKDYASCTDRRAWVTNDEPRRQYILEIIKSTSKKGSALGTYVPVETLVDILLSEKVAENEKLRRKIKELEELLAFYDTLELTAEQKAKLKDFRERMDATGTSSFFSGVGDEDEEGIMIGGARAGSRGAGAGSRGAGARGAGGPGAAARKGGAEDEEGIGGAGAKGAGGIGAEAAEKDKKGTEEGLYCASGGGGLVKKSPATSSGVATPDRNFVPGGTSTPIGGSAASSRGSSRGRTPSPAGTSRSGGTSGSTTPVGIMRRPSTDVGSGSGQSKSGSPKSGRPGRPVRVSSSRSGQTPGARTPSSDDTRAVRRDSNKELRFGGATTGTSTGPSTGPSAGPSAGTITTVSDLTTSTQTSVDSKYATLQKLLREKDEEINKLKQELGQVMQILTDSKDDLKQQLTHSQLQLASMAKDKAQLAKTVATTKPPDISAMEAQIEELRSRGELTADQETEIIKKELEMLRKYCDNLSNIQEENDQLKTEVENLRRIVKEEGKGDDKEKQELQQKVEEYGQQIKLLQSKLNTSMSDLLNSDEIQNLRRKSEIVDDVLNEREQMRSELKEMEQLRRRSQQADALEDELKTLKKFRAEEANKSTSEMKRVSQQLSSTSCELTNLKNEKDKLNRALISVQNERDDLLKQLSLFENEMSSHDKELDQLRRKSQESDLIKLDRDRMQLRVEELQALEVEVLTLVEQIKNMSIERDTYKRQVCELECVVADQEAEIKQLLSHIDRLSESIEGQQEKIKTTLQNMQAQLDEKNEMLASSSNELANMKAMKTTLEKLKKSLQEKNELICQLTNCAESSANTSNMTRALQETQRENERLQQLVAALQRACQFNHIDIMLAESKQAVDIVINEVKSFYDEEQQRVCNDFYDDNLYDENKQLRKHSMDMQNLAEKRISEITRQLQSTIEENATLRAENDLLQSGNKAIKQIHPQQRDQESTTTMCRCFDLIQEIEALKRENDYLRGELGLLKGQAVVEPCPAKPQVAKPKPAPINEEEESDAEFDCKSFTTVEEDLEREHEAEMLETEETVRKKAVSISKEVIVISEAVSICMTLSEETPTPSEPKEPSAFEELSFSVKPLISVEPLASEESSASVEPSTSVKPFTYVDTFASEESSASVEPSISVQPSASEKPSASVEQSTSVQPSASEKPSASVEQSTSVEPSISVKPFASEEPSAAPETIEIYNLEPASQSALPSEEPVIVDVYSLTEQPTVQEHIAEKPIAQKPSTQVPTAQEPTAQKPTTQEPTAQKPTTQVPTAQEPTAQELTAQESTAQESTAQKPTAQESTAQESTAQKPTAQKPTTEISPDYIEFEEPEQKSDLTYEQKYEVEATIRKSIEEANQVLQEELQEKQALVQRLSQEIEQIPMQTMELLSSVSSQFKQESENLKSENDQLKAELAKLEKELKEKTHQLAVHDGDASEVNQRLQAELLELQHELEAYAASSSQALDQSENGIQHLQRINKELETQVNNLKNEIDRLAQLLTEGGIGEAGELAVINKRQKEEIGRLEGQLRGLIDINAEVRRTSLTMGAESTDMKVINYQLQTQIKELLAENKKLKERVQGDNQESESLKELIRAQEKEVAELNAINKNLSFSLQSSRLSLESGDIADDKCKQMIHKLKNDILDLQCENNCLRMCLTSTSPTDDKMATMELDNRDRNKRLEMELQELKDELECMRTCEANGGDTDAELMELREENAELRDKLKRLMRGSAVLEEELGSELGKLRAMVNKLQKENSTLSDQLKVYGQGGDSQIGNLLARIKELEETKVDCDARVEKMKQEMKDLMNRLESNVKRGSITETELEAEIRRLKAKIVELEDTISKQQHTVKKLQVSDDDSRTDELLARIKELEADKTHLENRVAQNQREQDELTDKLGDKIRKSSLQETEFEGEVIKLRSKVKELENVIKDLEAQLQDAKGRLSESADKMKSVNLEKELDGISAQKKALQKEKDMLALENSDLKNQLEELERKLADLKTGNNKLRGSLGELETNKEVIDDLKNQIKALKAQLEQCKAEKSQDKALIDSLRKQNDASNTDMKTLTNKLQLGGTPDERVDKDKLNALVKQLEQQLKDCQGEKGTNLAEQLRQLQAKYDKLKSEHEKQLKDLQAQYDKNLALAKEQYDRDLAFVKGRHSDGITRLQSVHEDNQKEVIKNFEREVDNLNKQLAESANKLKVCQDSLRTKQDECNELQRQIKSAQDSLQPRNNEIAKLQNDLENANTKISDLDKQLTDEKKKTADAQKALEALKNELESNNGDLTKTLQAEKAKATDALNQLEEVKKKLSVTEDELAKLKNDLESKVAELTSALASEKSKNYDLSKQLDTEQAKSAELAHKSAELAHKSAELAQSLADEQSKNKTANEELDKVKKDLANEQSKLESVQKDLDSEKSIAADASQASEQLSKAQKDLENEINKNLKLTKDLEAKEAEIAQLKKDIDDKKNELINEIADLKNQLKDQRVQQEISSLGDSEELEKLRKQLDEANKNLAGKEAALSKLEEDLTKAQNAANEMAEAEKKKCSDKDDEIEELKRQLATKNDEVSTMGKHVETEKQKSENYAKNLEAEKQRRSSLLDELSEAKSSSSRERRRSQALAKDLDEERERAKAAANALNAENAEKISMADELSKLKRMSMSSMKETEGTLKPTSRAAAKEKAEKGTSVKPKLDKLTKCTALIAEIKKQHGEERLALSTKTIIMTNLPPVCGGTAQTGDGFDIGKEIVTFEEERPINLTKSIEKILAKALKSGLENLTFEELLDLHTKTTNAANTISDTMERPGTCPCPPCVPQPQPQPQPKVYLMRRIATLETELANKHKAAAEKMQILDRTLQVEKQRLVDMKNALILERKRNNDLCQRIGMQTRENANIEVERDLLKRQSSYHEDRLQKLIVTMEYEKAERRKLEEELGKGKNIERSLKALLETEKERSKHIKCKANETIDLLRVRLEKALDSESQLKMQLSQTQTTGRICGRKPSQPTTDIVTPGFHSRPRSRSRSSNRCASTCQHQK